jgi:non-ribosomal peptide synthetase component F
MGKSGRYQLLSTKEPEVSNLAVYNSQPAAPPQTLLDILDDCIKAHPQHPAIDNGQRCLTYGQLQQEIALRVATLRASQIGVGDRVGIRMTSGTVDLYVSILADLTAGAAYVPVDIDDPEERANTVWAESCVCGLDRWPAIDIPRLSGFVQI